MKECPFCAEDIQEAAIVCKHCGRDQSLPAIPERATRRRRTGRIVIAVALVLGLAFACNVVMSPEFQRALDGGHDADTRTPLERATEDQRASILKGVITSSGSTCPEVTTIFCQGTAKDGATFWNARCQGGQNFAVRIADDRRGSTKVIDCIDLRSYTDVKCFEAFK
jgi:hypothetical protein